MRPKLLVDIDCVEGDPEAVGDLSGIDGIAGATATLFMIESPLEDWKQRVLFPV